MPLIVVCIRFWGTVVTNSPCCVEPEKIFWTDSETYDSCCRSALVLRRSRMFIVLY